MTIGKKIKELRTAQNMKQSDLAALLDVSFQAVSKWERDKCLPSIRLLPQIARLLGVSIDELFQIPLAEEYKRIENMFYNKKFSDRTFTYCVKVLDRVSDGAYDTWHILA